MDPLLVVAAVASVLAARHSRVWPLRVAGTAALGVRVGTGIAAGDPDGEPGEVGFPGNAVPAA